MVFSWNQTLWILFLIVKQSKHQKYNYTKTWMFNDGI